ncbi:hypothetical protein AB4Z09_18965 [Rhodococcus sp. TAF43]|uniref:hypothetical protein n=1 Tax=Rhodococcus sp. TAF43 TaxID=3237483 RepID=UPI003F94B417
MDTTDEHEATAVPAQPHRPRPPRPDVVVAPLHTPTAVTPPHALAAALAAWTASFVVFVGLLGALALDGRVRDALESDLADRNPTAAAGDVSGVVSLTVPAVVGIGLLVMLTAVFAILRLRRRRRGGRTGLAVAALPTIVAAVATWNLLSGAWDTSVRALTWAPLLQAGLVVVGTALLFAPAVSAWLDRPAGGTP